MVLGFGVDGFRPRSPATHWLTLEKSSKIPETFLENDMQPLRDEVRKIGGSVHIDPGTGAKRVKA